MAIHRGAKKSFSQIVDGTNVLQATDANQTYDEVEAIESELGVSDTPVATSVRCRLLTVESDVVVLEASTIFDPLDYVGDGGGDSRENVTFPNNMVVKRGTDTTHTGNHTGGVLSATVSFNANFPNACLCVICTLRDSAAATVIISTNTIGVGGFSYKMNEYSAAAQNMGGVDWIAIGY